MLFTDYFYYLNFSYFSDLSIGPLFSIQIDNPSVDITFKEMGTIKPSTIFDLNYTETIIGITTNKNVIFTKQ